MNQTDAILDSYHRFGFCRIPECVPDDWVCRLRTHTDLARLRTESQEAVGNMSGVYALRNLVDVVPEITNLIRIPEISGIVEAILGRGAFMVRSTLFDKTDGANWGVFWHQDLAIAVREKYEIPGFSAWTRKAGVHCVQPPLEIMSRILTIRIHLDDCPADRGALRVIPQSHTAKRLRSDQIEQMTDSSREIICELPAGGVLLMCPLLLHSSSPMKQSGQRRVVHLEFSAEELPEPLEWMYRIPISGVSLSPAG